MLDAAPSQLQPIRQELQLSRGAPMLSGERAWIVYDPLRQRYFQIGRRAFELLTDWRKGTVNRPSDDDSSAAKGIYSDSEIATMEQFLNQNDLLDKQGSGVAADLIQRNAAGQQSALAKLMRNYLFFRVPLLRPDRFLKATLPYISSLFTRTFMFGTFMLGLFALFLVSRQWDEFTHTFVQFFSFKGAVLFAITLTLVKTIHELAHGFMAARFGVRVPVMGVAFLLMFPMLYTDVSDAWRLTSRRQKLLIDGAGILAELILAVFATLLWVFLPDSVFRSAAFFVATTSWTLSLLVNLNPLMRFDGYFILADALNITNLQARSTNLGKWLLREILFGLGLEPPENLPRKNAIQLALYAWAVWVYRFFLFLGIAIIVYYATFKVLGILLFLAEIILLIAIPIFHEFKAWWRMRSMIMGNFRSLALPCVLIGGIALLTLPLDKQVSVPAVLKASEQAHLFAPFPARIAILNVRPGQLVNKGDVIAVLTDYTKDHALRQTSLRIEMLDKRLARISSDAEDLANSLVLEREKAKEQQTFEGLRNEIGSLTITAGFDGRVAFLDKNIRKGLWVTETEPLATIVSNDGASVKGLVAEDGLERFHPGATGVFIPDDPLQDAVPVNVSAVATVADTHVSEPYLASIFDGPIAVEPDSEDRLKPVAAHYGVTFIPPDGTVTSTVLRGTVLVDAEPKSYLEDIFRNILRVLIRESGV